MAPTTVARFDSDELLDHRARRPTMHLVDGVVTGLTWPAVELQAASDAAGNDVLLLVGAEPDHAWRAFTTAVVDLALELAGAARRRPRRLSRARCPTPARPGSPSPPATRRSRRTISCGPPSTCPPACRRPSSAGPTSRPRRRRACGPRCRTTWRRCRTRRRASRSSTDSAASPASQVGNDALRGEADATRQRVDALVAENDEHKQMVRQLEASVDAEQESTDTALGVGPLPSGDELAAELERFLRDQNP